ncbi:hypothetical protein AVEN_191800-1 [Araneus ventricosus]|uniref:Uncharacterized protein n=1 Tax=Araneus ventricosus TaxID=182803 RepID=A0A4Y2MPF7_ARAVE|nr:hypothetical protein AVEN_191800-1 [Araneus ventricosus]
MLTPSQGIYKWHLPSGHFSKSAGGTKSHLSRISDGISMAKPKRKLKKRSSGSGAGKKFLPSGTHRTASTQPSHCFSGTCSFSDGEKCLNHIQTSSSRSGQKFLPSTPKVPIGNVSGRNGEHWLGLQDLLTSDSLESKNYRKHIREYNSALAFASIGAQIKPLPGTGPYCYRIHGKIYHMVSPLNSDHNKPGLDSMSRAINPFIDCYLQMHRIIEENPATNIRMVFMENGDLDLRGYNQPTSRTEIAAIFVGDCGEQPANRDI